MKKSVCKKLVIISVLMLTFSLLTSLRAFSDVCEFFATTFSRYWITAFGTVFGILPFSMYELFLIVAIVLLVVFVVFVIIRLAKHKWWQALSLAMTAVIVVLAFLNVYTSTASFAYGRDPLPTEIYTEYTSEDFSYDQAVDLASKLIDQLNEAYAGTTRDDQGNIVYPFDDNELSQLLAQEYAKLNSDYFSAYTPRAKRLINKTIMSEMHIVGVFFAPFGEANLNGYETNLYLPHTLAHEMAHGKGVMREWEANVVASYVLLCSDNVYLRYGELARMVTTALSLVSAYPDSNDTYAQLYSKVDKGVWVERANYSKFYSQFTLLDDIGKFFNDLYLKLQNQSGGTDSYVKPGEMEGTGEIDGDGDEIMNIITFWENENLLIKLYQNGIFD